MKNCNNKYYMSLNNDNTDDKKNENVKNEYKSNVGITY